MPAFRVMVVEDQVIVGKELRATLEKAGYDVATVVTRGEDALGLVEQDKPDLILMDIVLRGRMDGIETAREILSRWSVPIIFITAFADEKVPALAGTAKPFGYLSKPFQERELLASVEAALDRNQAQAVGATSRPGRQPA